MASKSHTVMVVDDEPGVLESFKMILKDTYDVVLKDNASDALEHLDREEVDLVLLDIIMPKVDGMEVLRRVRGMPDPPEVIMVTATQTRKTAVEAMKLGAYDYVTKPFDVDEMKLILGRALYKRDLLNEVKRKDQEKDALQKEVRQLRTEVQKTYGLDNLVGESKPMQEIFRNIALLAPTESSVMIYGESGTGKELIARAIHYHTDSRRKDKPFMPLDCNTLPETLLESELFGHEKGAFTGATKKVGRCEMANHGTLFLDEIGELTPSTQIRLLRFLQEHQFMRVGGTKSIQVDVRIIAATNKNLEEAVKKGEFREDLYYRINVVPIYVPPLRQRKEDIPMLVDYFVRDFRQRMNLSKKELSPETVDRLTEYSWPGNVRELKNVIERILVLSPGDVISPEDLPGFIRTENDISRYKQRALAGEMSLEEAGEQFMKELINEALARANGVQTKAAEMLKTSRRTLKYQMDKLGIS